MNIKYGESASGAEDASVLRAYVEFGYVHNGYSSFSNTLIYTDVKNGCPVQVVGGKDKRHTWVADGILLQHQWVTTCVQFYRNNQLIHEVEGTVPTKKSSGSYVHHNFGWDGLQDGWYASLEPYNCLHVKPGEPNPSDYREKMEVIAGIRPR